MLPEIVLSLALVFSTASQLRMLGGVVGPAEILLVIWVLLATGRIIGRLGPGLTPMLSLLLVFWAVFALAEGAGALVGFATEEIRDTPSTLHDTLSYVLLAAVSCLCVVEPHAAARLRRVAWMFVTMGSVLLMVMVANAWGVFAIPGVEPWFFERLQGWSDNPNQLALLCAALGLLSLHLAESSRHIFGMIVAALCGVLPVIVGRMSGSDTFTIILLATGPVFGALKLRSWLMPIRERLTFRSAAAWLVVLGMPLMMATTAVLGTALAVRGEDITSQVLKNGGKEGSGESQLRFALWNEAFGRGLDAGLLGLGPGAHLNSTPYKRVPPPNFEAHNTPLDLFTQGGLLAVASFGAIMATGLVRTYRANLAGLTVLLGGIGIFSMFHLIVRHPIFWFVIALCLVAKSQRAVTPTREIRTRRRRNARELIPCAE